MSAIWEHVEIRERYNSVTDLSNLIREFSYSCKYMFNYLIQLESSVIQVGGSLIHLKSAANNKCALLFLTYFKIKNFRWGFNFIFFLG